QIMNTLEWWSYQAARIKESVRDEEFAHINYAELVPVTTDGDEWAAGIGLISTDAVGQAEFINGNADDIPIADINLGGEITPVHLIAVSYAYGLQEIEQSR